MRPDSLLDIHGRFHSPNSRIIINQAIAKRLHIFGNTNKQGGSLRICPDSGFTEEGRLIDNPATDDKRR